MKLEIKIKTITFKGVQSNNKQNNESTDKKYTKVEITMFDHI